MSSAYHVGSSSEKATWIPGVSKTLLICEVYLERDRLCNSVCVKIEMNAQL